MARKKISQLESAVDITANDLIQVIDIEDVDMATSGTNKKATAQLLANELGKLTNVTSTGSTTTRSIANRFADVVNVKDFGVAGDGTDETTKIQAALNASVGKILILGENKTYNITSITIPSGVTIFSNGSVFRKIAASSTQGILISSNVQADSIILSSPGSSSDFGIRIAGSNVRIDKISSKSDSVDSNIGIRFQSTDGTPLEGVRCDNIEVENFLAGVLIYYVGNSSFNNIRVIRYRTGVYLRDVYQTNFYGAYLTLTSPSALGTAGNNGLLVESTLSSGSANNLRFDNWTVVNAAEHSYRFGGGFMIQDVWMSNCRSTLSGNGGATAEGGCGFKVLGATFVAGEHHRDFRFENCIVEDVNTNGTGVGNFCGFLIANAINVHISNCSVLKRSYEYSCWHAYSFESVIGVFLTNNYCENARQHGLRISAGTYSGLPGFTGINKNINITGGYYGNDPSVGSAVLRLNSDGSTAPGSVENMIISGSQFDGGNAAVRAETTVTYTNNQFNIIYFNSNALATQPAFLGSNSIIYNVVAPWSPAFGSSGANTSVYQDVTNGSVKIRKAGAWVTL